MEQAISEEENLINMKKCPRKEYMKQWRKVNKERINEKNRKYRNTHKRQVKIWRERYYRKHKKKVVKSQKNYYERNREKYLLYYKGIRKNPERIYGHYKNNAQRKKIEWELTYKEFKTFWQKPCYYCQDKIETIGLDRIDSKKGYKLNNIVPCCSMCNKMKMDFNQKDFINQCRKIIEIND